MTYPANYSLNPQIRRVLYALKRQYGGTVTIYQNGTVTTDTKTGAVSRLKTATKIHRVVILPARVSREVKQSISVISANKQLVGGGGWEQGKRVFIVDRHDIPDLVLAESDWIGFNGRKYTLENFDEYEFDAAYVIVAKEIKGEALGVLGSIKNEAATDTMTFSSEVTGEV
jgi:hypothetical protein